MHVSYWDLQCRCCNILNSKIVSLNGKWCDEKHPNYRVGIAVIRLAGTVRSTWWISRKLEHHGEDHQKHKQVLCITSEWETHLREGIWLGALTGSMGARWCVTCFDSAAQNEYRMLNVYRDPMLLACLYRIPCGGRCVAIIRGHFGNFWKNVYRTGNDVSIINNNKWQLFR